MRLMSKDEWTYSFQVCASNFMVVESATGNKKKASSCEGQYKLHKVMSTLSSYQMHGQTHTQQQIHQTKSTNSQLQNPI